MKYSLSFYHKYMFSVENSVDYEEVIFNFLTEIKSLRELEKEGKVEFDFEGSSDGWVFIYTNDAQIAKDFGFDEEDPDDEEFEEDEN